MKRSLENVKTLEEAAGQLRGSHNRCITRNVRRGQLSTVIFVSITISDHSSKSPSKATAIQTVQAIRY